MKPIKEILSDSKPKNIEKINKAFEKSGYIQYKDSFIAEALSSSAKDFPKDKCMVTDTYFCCYELFMNSVFANQITVIPLSEISNIYRSNITAANDFDYDNFHIQVELKDGSTIFATSAPRNAKTFSTLFGETIACVKSRITSEGAEV